ncbi:hypothetical protein M9H77_07123 [Catharanthus roseus]|uniref:Uncharacterized protein n=1 Tax=Catharanthus roseus TaxID=4058 RepID=A0ACC0BUA9_CATRO|nr:hypothetical protein M9H77_07123 [Catharanthus roseus]
MNQAWAFLLQTITMLAPCSFVHSRKLLISSQLLFFLFLQQYFSVSSLHTGRIPNSVRRSNSNST